MPKMTIYLPDDLAAEVEKELPGRNISAICQDALRDELTRARARAKITAEGFQRIEAYDEDRGHDVAFQGREIGAFDYGIDGAGSAYLTPKGAIAVHTSGGIGEKVTVYDDYDEFAGDDLPDDLRRSVAESLGEKYIEELDI